MPIIPCRWKVELDGVNLYDDAGKLLVHFIPFVMDSGDPELSTDVYCEWDGADRAHRWDDGIENITYRKD
tara:strand:+ start:418 stop:627 length:210 start_codon:yes stop_codon:yes gene_type:complete